MTWVGSGSAVGDMATQSSCCPFLIPFPVYSAKPFRFLTEQGRGRQSWGIWPGRDRTTLYIPATYWIGSPSPCGILDLIALPPARKNPKSSANKEHESRNLHIRCALGPSLGVVVRSPWAVLDCPSLYPVLLKRDPWNLTNSFNFTSALVCTPGKGPALATLQPFLLPGGTTSPGGCELSS